MTATTDRPADEKVNILLVDDQPANLLALEAILRPLDQNLVRAQSGERALRRLLDADFAVILLDVQMQGLDGFETAELIRGRDRSRHTPIIFLTAHESRDFPAARAYALGAVDYLIKPLVPEALRAKVSQFVQLFQITEQARRQGERLRRMERAEFERQLVEESLRRSEERFRLMADSAPVLLWLSDPDGRRAFFNKPWLEFTGRSAEQEAGDGWAEGIHPDDRTACRETTRAALFRRNSFRVEYRLRRADGAYRWVLESGTPRFDPDGRFAGHIGSVLDITERREAEEERLRRSRQLEVLSGAGRQLNLVLDESVVLASLVGAAMELVEAEGGTAGLLRQGKIPFTQYNHAGQVQPIDFTFAPGEGVAGWVLQTQLPYRCDDPAADPHARPDVRQALGIRNLVCVPLLGRQGELMGCFQLYNKRGGRTFDEVDVAMLQSLAAGAAIALENAELLRQVREADRHKQELLAMLAHELRNPLAPILTSLHIARQPETDAATCDSVLDMGIRQARHLARLVDQLLDVSLITRGEVRLRSERLDLARLVRTTAGDRGPLLERSGLALSLDVPETPVWVRGDATRLTQVVSNLLDNAVKFTEQGGRVTVSLTADVEGGQAMLTVRDTGIGIEPDMQVRLWEVFAQADRSLERTRGGLGLGLSLVKGIVAMHGGTVEASSPGRGQGAVFVVRLPVEAEPVALAPLPAEPSPVVRGLRVLIVEDNRAAAGSLSMLLEAQGHEVRVAYTGPEGVRAAGSWPPDVVLCDIGLPGLDGYGVARELRANPATSGTPLLALTGYGTDEDRNRSHEAGFNAHLVKPVDPAELQQVLSSYSPQA